MSNDMNNASAVYDGDYLPYVIRWGRLTNCLGLVLSFGPALVLLAVFGIIPPVSAIVNGFIAIASAVGVVWFIEPVSYFPIIGVSGTYMAFISGNIGNLRIPCAMVAQKIAGVEPGTPEGTIVSTLGMAVSIVVNTLLLTAGAVAGVQILQQLPPEVRAALQLLLPSLFGAVFMQFALRDLKMGVIVLVISVLMLLGSRQGFYPAFIASLATLFLSVAIGVFFFKQKQKRTQMG